MQLGSNQKQMQQDYAAWYTFVEEPRLRKEAARKKAAKDKTSNVDALVGYVVIAAIIYVGSVVVEVYRYLVDIVASALSSLAAFVPFL